MKPNEKIHCACSKCERQWSIELIATLPKDKKKSCVVACPFCDASNVITTDKQKDQKTTLKDINEWQQDSLSAFRKKLGASSNMEALDKLDNIKRALQDLHGDSVKYPQLSLHPNTLKHLESILDQFKEIPF